MTTKNWTATDLPNLSGKSIVVTGATSGLGEATSRALAAAGADLVLAVRNVSKGDAVAASIPGNTTVRELDLGSLASIRAFAQSWTEPVDVLINNAGIMGVPEGRTPDDFELQIGTNHFGHFSLTNLLLPHIRGRVVTVTSNLHRGAKLDIDDLNWTRRKYNGSQAYKDSKLANLLFARELQRRLTVSNSPVLSVAAHPGFARTSILTNVGGLAGVGFKIGSRLIAQDAENGSLPTLFAATQKVAGGSLIGPSGYQQLRGYPENVTSSPDSNDTDLAQALWQVSESLTHTELNLGAGT
jgi:NAD(P)-dependent dehydrogenase (short-subunit alcohol dehydrogenase family)